MEAGIRKRGKERNGEGDNDDANAITQIAKCISALFIAMYDIYRYIFIIRIHVSVLDANVSRPRERERGRGGGGRGRSSCGI